MKKLMVAIAILAVSATASLASKIEVDYMPDSNSYCSLALIQQPLDNAEGLGIFAYELVGKDWSQAYAGLTYAPIPQLEVGLGYGVEKAPNPTRIGGWVWAGQDRVSALYLFEDGGSGPWHRLELKYRATDLVTLGYVERKYTGEGAIVEVMVTKSDCIRLFAFKEGSNELSLIHYF